VSWSWESGTWHERGVMVRSHRHPRLTEDRLCGLFNLTKEGLRRIMGGKDWRPLDDRTEFERHRRALARLRADNIAKRLNVLTN
jgi:hypothetical protein